MIYQEYLLKKKQLLCLFILAVLVAGCADDSKEYDYIKIFTIGDADTVTPLNKGMGLSNFLYYSPHSDSAILRFTKSINPNIFHTFSGYFDRKEYADTLALLVSVLKRHKNGVLPYSIDTNSWYCGPVLYVEYGDLKGKHYNTFIIDDNDTLSFASDFFHRLENLPWEKQKIENKEIDGTSELVNVLKGLGKYDSIEAPYIPLPCKVGIDLDKLYGSWRTMGSRYSGASTDYYINKIDRSGTWVTERVLDGKTTLKYSGKIKEIRNNKIVVVSKYGSVILKITNLTHNCFEYLIEKDKFMDRLDRLE